MKTPDRCTKCPSMLMQHEEVMCSRCRDKEAARVADLRERWDRAFCAALTGLCANTQIIDTDKVVIEAEKTADLTIRRGTASRDAAIAEVVG